MLIDIAEGKPARQPARMGPIVDMILGLVALATLVFAVLRWRRPVKSRAVWRNGIGFLIAAAPVLWLGFYPAVLRILAGRDLNWPQSLYATPMLLALVAVLAFVGIGSIVRRLRRL